MDGDYEEMPIGLSFQLGLSKKALSAYARLSEKEKRQVTEAARQVSSKSEMKQLVSGLEHSFYDAGLQKKD